MIAGRVRQFLWALSARVSAEDREFVEKMLAPVLQDLFFAMSVADQCHALRTARCAQKLMPASPAPVDSSFLTRCALLHDIGRKKGDLGILWKSAAVLLAAMCPRYAYACGNHRESLLHKKMRVYFHHAEIGADILEGLGFAAEAAIIRKHHKAPAEDDPPELRILRMADARS